MAISNLVNQTTPSTTKKTTGLFSAPSKLKYPLMASGTTATSAVPKAPSIAVQPPASPTQQGVYTSPGTSAGQPIQQTPPQPITGNTQTPSGATVNANTGALVQAPPQTTNRGLFPDVVSSIAKRGDYTNPVVDEATRKYNELSDTITRSRKNQAQAEASQLLAPIPIGDATGRQAVTRGQYLQEQAALADQLGYYRDVAGIGQREQELEQSALGTAAGYAQPALGSFGQGYYNPLDPTGGAAGAGGGTLNPLNNIDDLARDVISGRRSPGAAFQMGGNVPNFQAAFDAALRKIDNNVNIADLQARYDARQQAGTLAGVAPTSAAAGTYEQAFQAYNTMSGQVKNVDGLGNLLLDVARSGAINPTDLTLGNRTIADLKRNLSDAEQTRFDSALSAFSGAASLLLSSGSGQIPTDVSANIARIANGSLPLPALTAMIDQAKREGTVKLQTAASLVNTPGSFIGAPKVSAPQATGGGGDYNAYLQAIQGK